MLKDFKDFIAKGNVVDLAVAVVIGAAFGLVVKSLTDNILMPIIGIIFGKPTFDQALILTINESNIRFGSFITAVVNFLIIAVALFVIVQAFERMQNLRKRPAEESVEVQLTEVDLLVEIRDLLVAQRDS